MIRVCPEPKIWHEIYTKLNKIHQSNIHVPPPPINLILAGWTLSDDVQKKNRWDETLVWIEKYGGKEIIINLKEEDFYYAEKLSKFDYFKYGNTSDPAIRPNDQDLSDFIKIIQQKWFEIAEENADFTKPINFSGLKARCLIVEYDNRNLPSWGTWGNETGGYRNQKFTDKSKFSLLRKKINEVISPHKIDHIIFKPKKSNGKN